MSETPWVNPRQTPDRDDRYMGLAFVLAGFSKDPRTQMGAYIVTAENEPRGGGYNGPSKRIDDDKINWSREAGKNDIIAHAEENALKYANGPVEGCTIYVTGHPCKECMDILGRKGIKRIVYLERPYDSNSMQANKAAFDRSMEIAKLYKMQVEVYKGSLAWLLDWLGHNKQQGILPI